MRLNRTVCSNSGDEIGVGDDVGTIDDDGDGDGIIDDVVITNEQNISVIYYFL